MDGTPVFAEAECIIIRSIHRTTYKIHEFVVCLSLYSESLDGATLAQHAVEILQGNPCDPESRGLGKYLSNWKATGIDRAGTNKKAHKIIKEDYGVEPFTAFCFAHGTSSCGKKVDAKLGGQVVRALAKMVKFRLCKARVVFSAAFGEKAKKIAGVRWHQYHEVCYQVNRIGLTRLRDEYAIKCATNGWSEKSAQKFLDIIEDDQDFWWASCEIASSVDIGIPLTQETYLSEMKLYGGFVQHEGIERLHEMFTQGVAGLDRLGGFVELEKQALAAELFIHTKYLVSTIYIHFH